MKNGKIWTKGFAALFGLRFISTLTYFVLNTTLVSIVYDLYRSDAWQAGLVVGAYMLGQVFGRLLLTRYVDIVGRKRTMLIMSALAAFFVVLYFFQSSIEMFVGVRLFHGVIQGLFSNVITSVGIASLRSSSRFGEGVATYSLSVSLATAVGPFLGLLMLQVFTYKGVFVLAIAIMALVFVGTLFVGIEDVPLSAEEKKALLHKRGISNYLELSAVPISVLVGFTSNAGYIIITSFLNSYAEELGLLQVSSLYFASYAAFLLLFRPLSGKVMDRYGDVAAILPAFVSNALGLFVLAFAANVPLLILSAALNALGQGCLFTSGQTIATRGADPLRLNIASSTYYVIADIGYTIGPVVFGFVVPVAGYSGMYLVAAAMMVVSAIVYLAFRKRV